MLQIILHTPFYVWFLLVYLMWSGWKSRNTYVISWKSLSIMPAIMFLWSIYATLTCYKIISICFWIVSIVIGIWFGSLTVRKLQLRFDKQQNLIEIAGNWIPMFLSIVIFALRYFLGAMHGLYPNLTESYGLQVVENVTTVISGMFAGRLVGYWQRFKLSSHVDLSAIKI